MCIADWNPLYHNVALYVLINNNALISGTVATS